VQAGYAVGLLLLSPLGDLVRRRQLILALVTLSGSLTIGLAVTHSLVAFEVLTFLVGIVTVTPQILMPFAADLAPPHKRASAISIVLSGLLFGVLLARVLAGVIANFVTWRVVYYLSIGLQFGVLTLLYLVLPDWPAKKPGKGRDVLRNPGIYGEIRSNGTLADPGLLYAIRRERLFFKLLGNFNVPPWRTAI